MLVHQKDVLHAREHERVRVLQHESHNRLQIDPRKCLINELNRSRLINLSGVTTSSNQETRKAERKENRTEGKQESRKAGKPESRKAGKQEKKKAHQTRANHGGET